MSKILIIQTAFIGDVVLATPLIESLAKSFPDDQVDFLLRKGNEGLLKDHPFVNKVLVWNKKRNKYKSLLYNLSLIRKEKYDYIINLQRFASTGFLTAFSKGRTRIGFKKNPFSFAFTHRIDHIFEEGIHEVDRNLRLLKPITTKVERKPKLYPSLADNKSVNQYINKPYACIAPASVWYTKQLPENQYVALCKFLKPDYHIYFLGAPSDAELCDRIIKNAGLAEATNFCGQLNFLESAALMEKAEMNYVNDSAPLHFASAVNAKTTAFFCSTIPRFGFGPLSDSATVAEVEMALECRPCGLHGKKECPEGHFDCGFKIDVSKHLPKK
jgi:heptosyltransferase-2